MDTLTRSSRRFAYSKHSYVREEKWRLFIRDAVVRKESKFSCASVLRTRPLGIDVGERSAISGFCVQSCFLKSENSVLVDLTTKSTQN